MITSLLDLAGVLLLGLVGALAVAAVQSQPLPATVASGIAALGLESLSIQQLVGVFAALAALTLLSKSAISTYLTRRVLRFLANRQASVSARLTEELLAQPLTFIQSRSSQETAFALIGGAGAATFLVLGSLVIALSEAALLFVLGVALLFISPQAALVSIAFFAVVAWGLQRSMGGWAGRVGAAAARADIASMDAIQEVVGSYREIVVLNRRAAYVDRIQGLRWTAARVVADSQFISMLPKYLFEGFLVVGGLLLAGFLFATQSATVAVGTIAVFLGAASRVMPSLMRLQGALLGLRGAAGIAAPTFRLAEDLGERKSEKDRASDQLLSQGVEGKEEFAPLVEVRNLSYSYPGADGPSLTEVSLKVAPGQSVAFVGPSGAGKSTLVDCILGILDVGPNQVLVGGVPPMVACARWPGKIAYVPQAIRLANSSVRNNVALGMAKSEVCDDLVWEALEKARLSDFIASLSMGLDSEIGEHGVKLSGGQRQRLGIARALYTRPKLLVLDEATSALDAETELAVSETIAGLEGEVTTLVVAHRLSTVRSVDLVVYLDHGLVMAQGSFSEVAEAVPALMHQARLMGMS